MSSSNSKKVVDLGNVRKVKPIGKAKAKVTPVSTVKKSALVGQVAPVGSKSAKPTTKVVEGKVKTVAKVEQSTKSKAAAATKTKSVAPAEKAKPAKSKDAKVNPIIGKINITLTDAKCKEKDGVVTVTVPTLTPELFGKVKSIGGKKATLATKGANWIITYE